MDIRWWLDMRLVKKRGGFSALSLRMMAHTVAQEMESKARRLIEELTRFCRNVGGRAKVRDTLDAYVFSCLFDKEKLTTFDVHSRKDDIYMIADTVLYKLEGVPKEKELTFGSLAILPEGPVATGRGAVKSLLTPAESYVHANVITDGFTFIIDKSYKKMEIRTPAIEV